MNKFKRLLFMNGKNLIFTLLVYSFFNNHAIANPPKRGCCLDSGTFKQTCITKLFTITYGPNAGRTTPTGQTNYSHSPVGSSCSCFVPLLFGAWDKNSKVGTVCMSTQRDTSNFINGTPPPPPRGIKIEKIQNCEVVRLSELGWSSGHKHNFCLSKGWSGGAIPAGSSGSCFRAITGLPATACPRLNRYYHKTDGYKCEHLSDEDARILRVCGK